MTVKRSVGAKQAIDSIDDDDKSERERAEPEAIVDELVMVSQPHTDNNSFFFICDHTFGNWFQTV